ncbi:non-specific lipid transfer protein GPI-anchored 30-like [Salvia hispanica]|uniref:non-specific lipid transfer protein GPI-anchored 30-like n=1 Tax=Salvia hispanica TaxID=49212 RepID=UPI0020091AB0|nr:non-specific lipid transfer protein GPI-anchored 30-like [Salvia hispanica]
MEHQIYAMKIAIFFFLFISQNLAQVQQQQCMNELQPCLNYLNGNTRPSDSCCQNLDNVIKSMPECLCAMISVKGADLAQQYINVTEAQTLPGRCGQRINPLGCVTGTPDTRSRNTVQNSSSSKLGILSLSMFVAALFVSLQAF